jgi:acetamidase/formamidase
MINSPFKFLFLFRLFVLTIDGIHQLTGPIAVETAEPGDALVVEILDVRPFETQPWGYTGVFERKLRLISSFGFFRNIQNFEFFRNIQKYAVD